MPDDSKFFQILGKALVDAEFRNSLVNEGTRESTLADLGVKLDKDQLRMLGESIASVQTFADAFSGSARIAS